MQLMPWSLKRAVSNLYAQIERMGGAVRSAKKYSDSARNVDMGKNARLCFLLLKMSGELLMLLNVTFFNVCAHEVT